MDPVESSFPSGYRLVSLAQPIDSTIPRWPGDPPPAFRTVATLSSDGFFLRELCLGEHSATHQNAPCSFFDDGADIASVEPVLLPLTVVDASDRFAENPSHRFDRDDLTDFESVCGKVQRGDFFVLNSGWHRFWSDPTRFLGSDDRNRLDFPSFDETAIDLLLERGVEGVGIDSHGIDAPDDDRYRCQKRLLAAGKRVVECLGNLDALPARGALILIAPLPVVGGSGSPLTPVALVPTTVSHATASQDIERRKP